MRPATCRCLLLAASLVSTFAMATPTPTTAQSDGEGRWYPNDNAPTTKFEYRVKTDDRGAWIEIHGQQSSPSEPDPPSQSATFDNTEPVAAPRATADRASSAQRAPSAPEHVYKVQAMNIGNASYDWFIQGSQQN